MALKRSMLMIYEHGLICEPEIIYILQCITIKVHDSIFQCKLIFRLHV